MTVTSTTDNRWGYEGDGINPIFPYTSKIFASTDLNVYLDGVLQVSGYTVTGVGDEAGGEVVFTPTPPVDDAVVLIIRNVPDEQPADVPSGGPLPSAVIERELDRRTILSQQHSDRLTRTLRIPDGDPITLNMLLPPVVGRAGKLLTFDGVGQPVMSNAKDFGVLSTGTQNIWEATQVARVGAGVSGWEIEDSSQNTKIQLLHAANGGGRLRIFDVAAVERVNINGEADPIVEFFTAGASSRLHLTSDPGPLVIAKVDAGEDGISVQNLSGNSRVKLRITGGDHGSIEIRDTGGNTVAVTGGNGNPEGTRSGNVGTLYLRSDGGVDTTMYIKSTGTGTTTGWRAITTAAP